MFCTITVARHSIQVMQARMFARRREERLEGFFFVMPTTVVQPVSLTHLQPLHILPQDDCQLLQS